MNRSGDGAGRRQRGSLTHLSAPQALIEDMVKVIHVAEGMGVWEEDIDVLSQIRCVRVCMCIHARARACVFVCLLFVSV